MFMYLIVTYLHVTVMITSLFLESQTLSACRECIGWDYGDVGAMWSRVDDKKFLRCN